MAIKKVGIISKPKKAEVGETVGPLLDWLRARSIEVCLDKETGASLARGEKCLTRNEIPSHVDLIIVLGGDGTLLAAARAINRKHVPLLAVNLGSLGFLTVITREELYSTLERVLAGDFETQSRVQIEGELVRADEAISWISNSSWTDGSYRITNPTASSSRPPRVRRRIRSPPAGLSWLPPSRRSS